MPLPIPGPVDRLDRKLMNLVRDPQGMVRKIALFITAFGSAPFTVPVELLGWFFSGPLYSVWFGLSLLADVPGHLSFIVPIRYVFQRQRPTPFTRAPLYFDHWNIYSFPSAHSLRTWTLGNRMVYWNAFVFMGVHCGGIGHNGHKNSIKKALSLRYYCWSIFRDSSGKYYGQIVSCWNCQPSVVGAFVSFSQLL